MGGKKNVGENSKKAAGNARVSITYIPLSESSNSTIRNVGKLMSFPLQKAEVAAGKKAAEDSKRAAEEDKQWSKGAKNTSKKYEQTAVLIHPKYTTNSRNR